jgi:hypothetical protein
MKCRVLLAACFLVACSIFGADPGAKDDVTNAVAKLANKPNYSWKTTYVVPENAPFRLGPSAGETEKGGYTHVTLSFGETKTEGVISGEKAAATDQDGAWQSAADLEKEEGPGRIVGIIFRNFRTPAAQAADLAAASKELKKDGETYSSELTEDGAKAFLRFRRSGEGPTVSDPKGSVKFWIKDGELVKFEFKVKGTLNFGGNDVDVDRATTVEINAVGATKVSVPDEAKKKLS